MSKIDKWTKFCQEELDNPNWYPWKFTRTKQGILCYGAECPLYIKGDKKGRPNYRRANMVTAETVLYPIKEQS